MRISSILVLCTGNICRSPTGQAALTAEMSNSPMAEIMIASAGLNAPDGHPADPVTMQEAALRGLDLTGHRSRQFNAKLGHAHDLILVMDSRHRVEVLSLLPELSGRVFLFSAWSDARDIADPYGRSTEFQRAVIDQIIAGARGWHNHLKDLQP